MKFEVDHHPETHIAMDIPKQTIHSGQAQSLKSESTIPSTKVITDIDQLKLETGRTYTATIIQAKDPIQAKTEQSSNQTSLPKDTASTPNAEKPISSNSTGLSRPDKAQSPIPKEWLISIKGKLALISSEKQLEIGQKLLLKLESSEAGNKPALLAQLLESKVMPQKPVQASLATNIQNTQVYAQANQFASNSRNVELLLQSINVTLDKQLSLQRGLSQIDTLLKSELTRSQSSSVSPQNQLNIKIIESIKQNLIDTLPKLKDIIQPNNNLSGTSNLSSQTVKESIRNSGIFFETSLAAKPETLAALKEKMATLETILNATTNSKNSLTTSANLTQAASNTPYSAIHKIQQTIENLLQLTSKQETHSAHTSAAKNTDTLANDLKANLLSLASLLNKQLAKNISEAELKQLFLGSMLDETIISPFSFPMIPSPQSKSTKALFDKQEFSTGQILKLLAGMIHKLQFNQLHSLLQSNTNNDSPLQQTWFFELPVLSPNQGVQSFNVRIDQEEKNNHEQTDSPETELQWKLLLSFDLSGLGPIYVQVTLSKDSISSVLWADNTSTLALLEQESVHFKEQLKKTGLNVGDILCQKGHPQTTKTKIDRHLVDTKA